MTSQQLSYIAEMRTVLLMTLALFHSIQRLITLTTMDALRKFPLT